jgi:2-C-methyl-D-erythritol 4-phosphate cytidylyltransferase
VSKTRPCIGIVLSGGSGRRFKPDVPKQFFQLEGKPIIRYSLDAMQRSEGIDGILVVYQAETRAQTVSIGSDIDKIIGYVEGGETRQDSVFRALEYLRDQNKPVDSVVIHDSVRPYFSTVLGSVLKEIGSNDGIIPVLQLCDALYRQEPDQTVSFPKREEYLRVQTPQGFRFPSIYEAHRKANEENKHHFPDDGSLFYHYGGRLMMVKGSPYNIKITTLVDIPIAKAFAIYFKE